MIWWMWKEKKKTDKKVFSVFLLFILHPIEPITHKHTFPDHTLFQRTSNPMTLLQGQHKNLYIKI